MAGEGEREGGGGFVVPTIVPIAWSVPKDRYLLSGPSRRPRVIHDHICIHLRCGASSRVIAASLHPPCRCPRPMSASHTGAGRISKNDFFSLPQTSCFLETVVRAMARENSDK